MVRAVQSVEFAAHAESVFMVLRSSPGPLYGDITESSRDLPIHSGPSEHE